MVSDTPRPVSRASQIPLYQQVANDLRQRILSGAWAPGRRIPSELELIAACRASRVTIRQALTELTQEGLLSREPGRGSFVRDPSITVGPHELKSFTSEMQARGLRASARVLSVDVRLAADDVAGRLGVHPGDRVVRIERLRLGDSEPVGLQVTFLPAAIFPGLETIDFHNASLYEELQHRYGTVIEEAEETYVATRVEGDTASALEVPDGTPGLLVERVGWSTGRPVEFTRSVMRGDRYRVQIRLRRRGMATHSRPRSARPPLRDGT